MYEISVTASKSYKVLVGTDILQELKAYIHSEYTSPKIMIVSDSQIWPIWKDHLHKALTDTTFEIYNFIIPAGEQSKCPEIYLKLLTNMADKHMTRSDTLIALGGGVVGDLTGFAAATYLRGIPYIQVPTSLLAMVDSSVGGKTAIDLPEGKNLVGAFYQPNYVLCDLQFLNTLPHEIFTDGVAEIIKYSILFDSELFNHLKKHLLNFDREYVISRCIELKRNIVNQDEYDTGARQKLNLGHTLGHAIEAHSNFTISHGKAVAMGTAMIANISAVHGLCSSEACDQILSLIESMGLPVSCPYSESTLINYILSDKKRNGNIINFIMPCFIGDCKIYPVNIENISSFIKV